MVEILKHVLAYVPGAEDDLKLCGELRHSLYFTIVILRDDYFHLLTQITVACLMTYITTNMKWMRLRDMMLCSKFGH